jgi:O-antigen/teichoic acid export membrane protein
LAKLQAASPPAHSQRFTGAWPQTPEARVAVDTLTVGSAPLSHTGNLTRRVFSQGMLLFSGFATAQICSFLRNAILGHMLAKGDFGVAATLTMVLQLIESLTDVGADRLIVQAPGGDAKRFIATAHSVLIGRGVLTAMLLYLLSGPFCRFLDIPAAQHAFEMVALVPFIKGFMHLDNRRAQRGLNNGPQVVIEVIPQAVALLLVMPALMLHADYTAVASVSIAQAITFVIASHVVAKLPYAVAMDRRVLQKMAAFGWPIWLSAFPMFAVYQGDRLFVGKFYGMETLAGFSVAFLFTMVPALIAAKVGHALMLPLLSSERKYPHSFASRYASLSSVTALAAALYLIMFGIAGGSIVPYAFGAQYQELGALTGWLALMWVVRMIQVVPGMAVMAHGETQPFLIAGLIRACTLPIALILALYQFKVEILAAAGALGEFASLIYIVLRAGRIDARLPGISLRSNAWLCGVAIAVAMANLCLMTGGKAEHIAAAMFLAACATGYVVMANTALSDGLASLLSRRRLSA